MNPFDERPMRKDSPVIIHSALSYLTGVKDEITIVDQRDYPLHICQPGPLGAIAFATARYPDNSEGMMTAIYVPSYLEPQHIIDWVGPCYKYIKYWISIPTFFKVTGDGRMGHKELLDKIQKNATDYRIDPKAVGTLVNGRKWLVSKEIPNVCSSPEKS